MGSKRALWRRSCKGKVRHECEQYADRHVRALEEQGEKGIRSYYCPFCHGWHVGHYFHKREEERLEKMG